jgi:hypothetical protein
MNNTKPRPVAILEGLNACVPSRTWTVIEQLRSKHRNRYPNWCFLPFEDCMNLLLRKVGLDPKAINVLHPLSAWRATKGIYQIDPDLLRELTKTPFTGDIPAEVLVHQPEWCVYVQLPHTVTIGDASLAGFFATVSLEDSRSEDPYLIIVWDSKNRRMDMDGIVCKGTIQQSVDSTIETAGYKLGSGTGLRRIAFTDEDRLDMYDRFHLAIPILLYLASVGKYCDIQPFAGGDSMPANPIGANPKPPKEPRQWKVGWRIGPELRRAIEAAAIADGSSKGTHASPRPHIRRAHMRKCRVGPGRLGVRSVWIPPVSVNCRYGKPIAVMRAVRDK